jgi:hypothetical protein
LITNAENYAKDMDIKNSKSPLNSVSNAWSSSFAEQEGYAKVWKENLFGVDGKSGIMGTA